MPLPTDLRPIQLLPVTAQMIGRRKLMYRSTKRQFPQYYRLFRNGEPMWSLAEVQEFLSSKVADVRVNEAVLVNLQNLIDEINSSDKGLL